MTFRVGLQAQVGGVARHHVLEVVDHVFRLAERADRCRAHGLELLVRDPDVHARVCAEVAAWLEQQDWAPCPIMTSPITGPEGNVEFLLAAQR